MEGILLSFASIIEKEIVQPYNLYLNSLPENYWLLFNLILYLFFIVVYSLFTFEFYDILSRKNILNLNKYNTSTNSFLKIFLAILFFIIEYLVLLPVLILIFFFILSFLLLLLSSQSLQQILLTSAVLIGAVRVMAYSKEELSKDLAKISLFVVLVIFLLSSNFPDFSPSLTRLVMLPSFLQYAIFYFVFLACLEILMKLSYLLSLSLKKLEKPKIEKIKIEEHPFISSTKETQTPAKPAKLKKSQKR